VAHVVGKRKNAGRNPGTSKKFRSAVPATLARRSPEVAVELLDPKEPKALRKPRGMNSGKCI
jgi:hypothetical protein